MACNKLRRNNYQQYNKDQAPQKLDDIFYGLELDESQIKFRDAIWDSNVIAVVCNSRAGTGKTLISLGVATMLVQYGFYDGIVYVMTATVEQKQGFLPGDQEAKSAPYSVPLEDALRTLGYDPRQVIISDNNMEGLKNGTAFINFTLDTYFRGINLENKVIIIDEAQNFYFDSLKTTLTRIHDNCKIIIIGHDKQCDIIKHPERSGFIPYLNAFKDYNENHCDRKVEICELTKNHRGWFSNFCDDVEPHYNLKRL